MKALSIRQPWAWLIINAGKDIENRSWPTRFRGRFLIHAGKAMTMDEFLDARAFVMDTLESVGKEIGLPTYTELRQMCGGIVGEAEIVGCVTDSQSPWFVGQFGFVIRNARPLPFSPCKGALGFFAPMIDPVKVSSKGTFLT